jgi:hypothetical protein
MKTTILAIRIDTSRVSIQIDGKSIVQYMGTSRVDYVLYPNSTVDTHVTCSNIPFKLETEIDRSRIIAFFGQVRDRLIILLRDERERIVPDIMDWHMTECDINKDIKLSHLLHLSAITVQVKYLDHLFRIYIKSMGKETVCRVEESLHPKKSALETINDIFNPMEKVQCLKQQTFSMQIYLKQTFSMQIYLKQTFPMLTYFQQIYNKPSCGGTHQKP